MFIGNDSRWTFGYMMGSSLCGQNMIYKQDILRPRLYCKYIRTDHEILALKWSFPEEYSNHTVLIFLDFHGDKSLKV